MTGKMLGGYSQNRRSWKPCWYTMPCDNSLETSTNPLADPDVPSGYFNGVALLVKPDPDLLRQGERCAQSRLKRTLDIVVAGGAVIALSPLLAVICLVLLTQRDGPVLFVQNRSGLNGKVFQIYKFRTMRHRTCATTFEQTKGADDARVTRLGRWLRKTSVDELPQLVNVLRGDMSLVGPRPHPLELDQQLQGMDSRYPLRLLVKPGLTGLAQINNARGPIDAVATLDRRLTLDLDYVRGWGPLSDLKLLLLTVGYLFGSRRDAY